jgi:hypothetical protein
MQPVPSSISESAKKWTRKIIPFPVCSMFQHNSKSLDCCHKCKCAYLLISIASIVLLTKMKQVVRLPASSDPNQQWIMDNTITILFPSRSFHGYCLRAATGAISLFPVDSSSPASEEGGWLNRRRRCTYSYLVGLS